MSKTIVLVGEDVGQANLARMREAFPGVEFRFCPTADEFMRQAADAEVIFSKRFPPEALDRAGRLRWVQAGTAGVERLLAMGLAERGVLLTNATGAHGVPMAEMILGMMLAFATGLHTLLWAQRAPPARSRAGRSGTSSSWKGRRCASWDWGTLAGRWPARRKPWACACSACAAARSPFPGWTASTRPTNCCRRCPRPTTSRSALPLTKETRHIVGERELRAMKPSAYIYNVGRGPSIEPTALLQALAEGWIAGAGLDVTDPEPLPEDSPLWDMPNVLLGQHSSGSSPLNADRITDILMDNLGRYVRGEPLVNVVDGGARVLGA